MSPAYAAAAFLLGGGVVVAAQHAENAWHNRRAVSVRRAMRRAQYLAIYSRPRFLVVDDVPTGRHALTARPAEPDIVDAELVDDPDEDLSADLPPLGATPPSPDEVLAAVRAIRASMPPGWSSAEQRMQERADQARVDAIAGRLRIAGAA